jgi:hypothetical protein
VGLGGVEVDGLDAEGCVGFAEDGGLDLHGVDLRLEFEV